MAMDNEVARMEEEADLLVFRILLKRARTIEVEMECEPDAKLSPTDLAALKELRRVAAESRERRSASDERALASDAIDPLAHQLGQSFMRGEVRDCYAIMEAIRQRDGASLPTHDGDVIELVAKHKRALSPATTDELERKHSP